MRLRAKFAILVVGIMVVPFLVVALVVTFRALVAETSESAPSYYQALRILRSHLSQSLGPAGSQANVEELSRLLPGVGFVVLDPEGVVVQSRLAAVTVGQRMQVADLLSHARRGREQYLLQVEALRTAGGREGLLLLFIPRDPSARRVQLALFSEFPVIRGLSLGMCGMGGLLLAATLGSILIVRSLTRSITRLETATRRIAEGDLSFELTARGKDEVASLTRSFERMRNALREEMERRSRFIMGVSHDLKTPLALIQGYVEAIADGYAEGQPEALKRYLSIIRSKSVGLEGMIDSLIDFARMETGEWKLSHKTLCARVFFRDLCHRFAEESLLLGRTLEYVLDIPEAATVTLDELLVTRALENLVSNAHRYSEPDGKILVTAKAVRGSLRFSVRDEGVGIPQEDLGRIFDPFYRGTGSRREEGHGLGLAVVKWVIESHGWTIDVSSAAGRGAEFFITLPLGDATAASPPTTPPAAHLATEAKALPSNR